MTLAQHLRAATSLAAIALNLAFWSVPLLLLLPAKAARRARPRYRRLTNRIYRAAVRVDNWLLRRVSGAAWRFDELTLDPHRPHVVLANHRSWADVLLVQSVVATRGPIVNFLTKRELLWVPIFGLIVFAFDFPAVRRRSRPGADPASRREDDRRRVSEAAASLLDSPAAILSFAEGTRFTEARRRAPRGTVRPAAAAAGRRPGRHPRGARAGRRHDRRRDARLPGVRDALGVPRRRGRAGDDPLGEDAHRSARAGADQGLAQRALAAQGRTAGRCRRRTKRPPNARHPTNDSTNESDREIAADRERAALAFKPEPRAASGLDTI